MNRASTSLATRYRFARRIGAYSVLKNSPFTLLRLLLLSIIGGTASAQNYPNKPPRIIIPATPGDSCDVLTRLVAQKISERLGQPFTIDNRAGVAGQLGLQLLAQASPDGYTLACGQGGNMVIAPLAYRKVAYDSAKDFAPIALIASNFSALAVHPSVPFRTVADLVKFAKANPGKLSFGSTGEGGFQHFTLELLRVQAGYSYLHVPYRGMSQIYTDVMGGRIDAVLASFISMQPLAASGRLRMLAIARASRMVDYPNVPTIAETIPGYTAGGWYGIVAPANTPREIILLLNSEINRALALPEIQNQMKSYGLEIHTESPEFFTETIRNDFARWGKLTRDIGFKPQ